MLRFLGGLTLAVLLTSACGKKLADEKAASSNISSAESALAIVNSPANETEAYNFDFETMAATCKASQARSDCNANNQINVHWGQCKATTGATYFGGWTNTYNSTNACMHAKTGALAPGEGVTRTSTGMTIQNPSGSQIKWSTNLHLTYDQQTIPSTGLTVNRWADARVITIGGLRRIFEDSKGNPLFDHSMISLNSIQLTGARNNGSRTLNGGAVRVYSNLEKLRTDITFNNLRWGSSQCCYPTSGEIQSVTSGSRGDTSTIRFDRSSCGQAFYESAGKTSVIALQQCD